VNRIDRTTRRKKYLPPTICFGSCRLQIEIVSWNPVIRELILREKALPHMKVKLFWKNIAMGNRGRDADALENAINVWLGEHPHVKIIDIKQSSAGGSFGPPWCFISVWYEEST
jgi:hypothetical protein